MSITFNVYRADVPMDIENMPPAIATGLTNKNYSDNTITRGQTYYYRVGAQKFDVEKFSDEIMVIADW